VLQSNTATAAASSALPPLRHPTATTKSVQTPNVNSLSLSGMFKVVIMVFQWIMTELTWFESEEDRIVAITKNCIETHEAKWLLEFIGPADYDCDK
jgi:hypothetical protein